MTENDKLVLPTKPPAFGGIKRGISLARQQAEEKIKSIDPLTVPNRIGLVLDDSGSMGQDGMENVHRGVNGFLASCNPNDTSVAVYPLNVEKKPLTVDYDLINLFVGSVWATGGTSLYTKLDEMIKNESITRAVVFSDGSPTDSKILGECQSYDAKPALAVSVVKNYQEKELPIDTIFIGMAESSGYKELKELARLTNGEFVHFSDSYKLSTSLKYLTPRFRALLANAEIKAKIERGENV